MQAATASAAAAIQGISGAIAKVSETAVGIAASVDQQGFATQKIARSIEHAGASAVNMTQSIQTVHLAVEDASGNAADVKRTTSVLASDTALLSTEVQEFLDALKDLGGGHRLRTLALDLPASAVVGEASVPSRVSSLSPAMAVFEGSLQTAPGTLVELRVASLEQPLYARFVERDGAGCRIQLLLNHEHLAFMDCVMTRLEASA